MKRFVVMIIWLFMTIHSGFAAPVDDITDSLMSRLSVEDINRFITGIDQELYGELPLLNKEFLKTVATQGLSIDINQFFPNLLRRILAEVTANFHLMGKLLFLAVLCALLQNLQTSFENSTIASLAYYVCYIFLIVISLTAFHNALLLARETVENMVGISQAILPLLITMLAGVGAITSAALLSPLMVLVISAVNLVVKDIVLPLLFLTAILECVNYMSANYRLTNLASVIKQTGMIVLGLTLVLFIGIISIQGAAGSVTDGLALRTAKYATATFVPVVGKMFSDTVELVMGASLMLKNSIGIFGVLTIGTICLFPAVKLLALVFIFKITGALIQPMGDERMAKCLDAIGNNLLLVFGGVLTAALMFFLIITIIIATGSAAMMLR